MSSIRTQAGLRLRVNNVARRMAVSQRTVRWWAKTRRLNAQRHGKRIWTFSEADVMALEERRTRGR
jgi:excisionase family DNA binding protein